jgi:hypothetical protein
VHANIGSVCTVRELALRTSNRRKRERPNATQFGDGKTWMQEELKFFSNKLGALAGSHDKLSRVLAAQHWGLMSEGSAICSRSSVFVSSDHSSFNFLAPFPI